MDGRKLAVSTAHNLGHHVVEFLHAQSETVDESAITYSVGFWSIAHPTGPKQWNAIPESGNLGILGNQMELPRNPCLTAWSLAKFSVHLFLPSREMTWSDIDDLIEGQRSSVIRSFRLPTN